MATKQAKRPIVFGSAEATEVLKKDIQRGVVGAGVPDYGKLPPRPKRDANGELIDYGDEEASEPPRRMTAEVSINGKDIGDLDQMVKAPTEEQEKAMADFVGRSRRVRVDLDLSAADAMAENFERRRQQPNAPAMLGVRWLPVNGIRTDGGTQNRVQFDPSTAGDYLRQFHANLESGDVTVEPNVRAWGSFPPIDVFFDEEAYWLADGFHRLRGFDDGSIVAACGIGSRFGVNGKANLTLPARVFLGTRRDAMLHAAGANASHGLRRTNADKRKAVEMLLRDEEWRQWSDAEIARRCAVDAKTVANIRHTLEVTLEIPESLVRKTADGREVNTSKIGARTEPTNYAPVWELESKVKEWLQNAGFGDHDLLLLAIRDLDESKVTVSSLLNRLAGSTYRKSDLRQAISNLSDQRSTKQRQAEARVVYVEPVAVEPKPIDPIVQSLLTEDLRSIIFADSLRIATVAQLEAAMEQVMTKDPDHRRFLKLGNRRDLLKLNAQANEAIAEYKGILDSIVPVPTSDELAAIEEAPAAEQLIDPIVSRLIDPATPTGSSAPYGLIDVIREASAPQLQEALRSLPDSLRVGRGPVLEVALKKRGFVPIPAPTPEPPPLTKVDTSEVIFAEPPAWAITCLEKMCKATGFKGQVGLTVHTGEFPTRVGVTDNPHAYARQGDDYTLIVLPEWAEDTHKWHTAIAHEFVHAMHADIDRFMRASLPEGQQAEYWQKVESAMKPFMVLLMVGMAVGAEWVEEDDKTGGGANG